MAKRKKSPRDTEKKQQVVKRFRFQNFNEQIENISIEAIRKVGGWSGDAMSTENASWFDESLAKWRELNCTAHFAQFCAEARKASRIELAEVLLQHLAVANSLALVPLTVLAAMLVHDLGEELYSHLSRFFEQLLVVLERATEAEVVESALQSLFYLVKFYGKKHPNELVDLFPLIESRLVSTRWHIRSFASQLCIFICQGCEDARKIVACVLEFVERAKDQRREVASKIIAGSMFSKLRLLKNKCLQTMELVFSRDCDLFHLVSTSALEMVSDRHRPELWKAVIDCFMLSGFSARDQLTSFLNLLETSGVCDWAPVFECLLLAAQTDEARTVDFVLSMVHKCQLDVLLKNRGVFKQILTATPKTTLESAAKLLKINAEYVELIFGKAFLVSTLAESFEVLKTQSLVLLDTWVSIDGSPDMLKLASRFADRVWPSLERIDDEEVLRYCCAVNILSRASNSAACLGLFYELSSKLETCEKESLDLMMLCLDATSTACSRYLLYSDAHK